MSPLKAFTNGIYKENPIFKLLLGMCPTIAVSLAVSNGIGMGLAATFVLVGSNLIIS
ncbi:MAG TPA: electron transport complex subunit E, partial [Firmicutes bacterium]|nr:electron transport complex subunit E [Bacillota bacterium]